jgi:hypothetical protein
MIAFVTPIFPFGLGRCLAPLLEAVLAHRRERRVLLAGGARAEAERRQAVADHFTARARIVAAEAAEREARAALEVDVALLQRRLVGRIAAALDP